MSDWTRVVESLAAGLLTGGMSTLATILAAFRDIRKRINDLEARVNVLTNTVGVPGDLMGEATGLFELLSVAKQAVERLRREITSWEDNPPTWAVKLIQRAERASVVTAEGQNDFEDRMAGRIRAFQDRLERVEDDLKHYQGQWADRYLSIMDYETDGKVRTQEYDRLKLQLATQNGLLRGIMSAMNISDAADPGTGRKITK